MAWGSRAFSGVTLGDSWFTVFVFKERGSATQEWAEAGAHGNSPQTWAFLGRRSLLALYPSWPFLLREGEALTYLISHNPLQNPPRIRILQMTEPAHRLLHGSGCVSARAHVVSLRVLPFLITQDNFPACHPLPSASYLMAGHLADG